MKFILEFKKWKPKYEVGDVVLIEYWYLDEENCPNELNKELKLTPVKIIEKVSNISYKVTHNLKNSKIKNAPDEVIKSSDIIDYHR